MTPFEIQCLLDIHCLAGQGENELNGSDAWGQFRNWALDEGLIKRAIQPANRTYETTERGAAMVKFLCDTPLPVCKWTLPERDNG